MRLEIDAVYQQGTLKLSGELPLREGEKVRIIVQPLGGAVEWLCGLIPWTGDPEELDRYLQDPGDF